MPAYSFSVITPAGKVFEDQVESVVAPGLLGLVGVLAGHAPMICETKPGLVKASAGGKDEFIATANGTLDVRPNGVVLLADWAAKGNSEDDAKAKLASRPEREK
jgi:F-type H+-transporting ATPase subunit epsilon